MDEDIALLQPWMAKLKIAAMGAARGGLAHPRSIAAVVIADQGHCGTSRSGHACGCTRRSRGDRVIYRDFLPALLVPERSALGCAVSLSHADAGNVPIGAWPRTAASINTPQAMPAARQPYRSSARGNSSGTVLLSLR